MLSRTLKQCFMTFFPTMHRKKLYFILRPRTHRILSAEMYVCLCLNQILKHNFFMFLICDDFYYLF